MSRVREGYRLDALVSYGAGIACRVAPSQKKYMSALEVSQPTASRRRSGDRHSPETKYLQQLASAPSANAWVAIAEGIAVVNQKQIAGAHTSTLEIRLRQLNDLEHSVEAEENRQTCATHCTNPSPDQREEAAIACIREAEINLERAAIHRELAARGRNQGH